MTFRNIILPFIYIAIILVSASSTSAAVVGDFNGDGKVTIDDVVFEYASVELGSKATAATIESRAKELFSSIVGSVSKVPDAGIDDVSGDASISIDDVVLTYAWVELGSSATTATVESRAKELYSAIDYLAKFPQMAIGSSTVPITITGIQTDWKPRIHEYLKEQTYKICLLF